MFSYRRFTVLAFIFKFMVHPKLVCVYRRRSVFILFPLEYPADPEPELVVQKVIITG